MKERFYILKIDKYEYGLIINALNNSRNELIKENGPTDDVDDILLKIIDAPTKK